MAKKHAVEDYEWAMYVDASGDDGFAFDRGSSTMYTVNCFMCETSEIEYNKEVLYTAKAVLRCDKNTEMKSSTVIKSKKRGEFCNVLSTLHGVLFQMVVFKKCFDPKSLTQEDKDKHVFSTLSHAFTIGMASSFHRHFQKSVCIIVDNMKSEEVIGTRENVNAGLSGIKHELIFADSKSTVHSLLQISDYFAGFTNKACTVHEDLIHRNPSYNRCATCQVRRMLCRRKPWTMQSALFFDIQKYVNLFAVFNDKPAYTIMGNGIKMIPENYADRYRFFDCVMNS